MKKNSNVLWGILLVALGLVFGLNSFGLLDIDLFFDGWWTLMIIIPSFISLFSAKDKVVSIVGLTVGILLLLVSQDILTFELIKKITVPLIFVVIGLCLMFKDSFNPKQKSAFEQMKRTSGPLPELAGVFSSQNTRYDGVAFEGADITAAFGGYVCGAENSLISKDCMVNCTAIFGGIDLYLPSNVNVLIRSTSIFGGVSDKRANTAPVPGPTVYVNALCLFGGVDVK